MWVKKTSDEIKRDLERSKRKPKISQTLLVIGAIMLLIFIRGGFEAATKGSYIVPFDELPNHFMEALLLIIPIMILSLIFGTRFSKREDADKEPILVCPKCERTKENDGFLACSCGGHYVDIKTMKWVEDQPLSYP